MAHPAIPGSYLVHLAADKTPAVVMAGFWIFINQFFALHWFGQLMSIGSIMLLVGIDLVTKLVACSHQQRPITSLEMRSKGLPKIRDYLLLFIAGVLSHVATGDPWGYRAAVTAMVVWELWSIAENLYDAGTVPFDIRKLGFPKGGPTPPAS